MVVSDLQGMLRALEPTLDATEYAFTPIPHRIRLEALSAFARGFFDEEEEALTFIIPSAVARAHGLPDEPRLRRIVLNVHSSARGRGTHRASILSSGTPGNPLQHSCRIPPRSCIRPGGAGAACPGYPQGGSTPGDAGGYERVNAAS